MIIHTLRLRGAIGIREGLGLEEINIDFRKFGPGLIAIMGENGSGKTSTIENLQPYRLLKSRPGGLARQFYLRDSCRDLVVGMNGDEYRFLIEMNPTLKTPAIKSYVYRNGEPLTPDGSEEAYNAVVTKLFGDPDLFFSSLFMPQKRVPFSKVDIAKRKELLLDLIGAGHLQAKCDFAAQAAKGLREEIARITGEIETLSRSARSLEAIDADIATCRIDLSAAQERLQQNDAEIARLKAELERLQAKQTQQAVLQEQLSKAKARREEVTADRQTVSSEFQRKISQLEIVVDSDRAEIDRLRHICTPDQVALVNAGLARADKVNAEYAAMHDQQIEYNRLMAEYGDARYKHDMAKQRHAGDLQLLESKVVNAQHALDDARKSYENKRANLTAEIARQTRATQILKTVPCQDDDIHIDIRDICTSCQFLKDATAALQTINGLNTQISSADLAWNEQQSKLSYVAADSQLAVDSYPAWEEKAAMLQAAIDRAKQAIDQLGFDAVAADKIKQEHDICRTADFPAQKARLDEAQGKIDALTQKVADNGVRSQELQTERATKLTALDQTLAAINQEISTVEPQIDVALDLRIRDAREALRVRESGRQATVESIANGEARIARLTEDKAKSEETARDLTARRLTLRQLQSDMADWEHLNQALSRTGGFQSMLVESAGAEITPFANEQLAQYGVPWTIEISTCRPSADGKKMVDGFFVTVNAPNGSRELSDLSGGEEVIVDQVIYDAIANMLRRRSGLDLRTAIRDECDGALDGDRAIDYIRATEAAHHISGLHHTLLITHREAIQQLIPNRLRFIKGKGIIQEVG